jgi:glycosyltransferase involved in cell wall biosynthesis
MKQRHVLHLVEYLYLGGIERLLEQLASKTDSSIKLYFFSYETETLSGIGKQIRDNGHPVYTYKKTAGRDWRLFQKLVNVIQNNKIDVIHTHDFGPIEYAIMLKIRFPKLKLIHTQHTIIHFVRNWKYTLFFQLSSYFYYRMISVSQYVKNVLLEQCPMVDRKTMIVIPNGVNTEYYLPSQNSFPSNILNLVSISRISTGKNIDYLLNTCRLLKQSKIPFVFHHAGAAKNQYELDKLLAYVKDNDLSEDVFFHGFIMDAKVILDLGDIFLSSSYTEGHPVALLEAMSCEKLCFCSDIPAHIEVGEDVIFLFDFKKEKSLYHLLTTYYQNHPDYSFKKIAARKKVVSNFSLDKMVDSYKRVYV